MSKAQVVNELYSSARRHFKRRPYVMRSIDDTFQVDLVELIPYAHQNKNYKYVLVVIDTFSKFLWTRPLKNKTGSEVAAAMKNILESSKRIPRNIQSDNGKEFFCRQWSELMKLYKINHYATYTTVKGCIVERVNRTILDKLYKAFAMQGNNKWLKTLSNIVKDYNEKKHHTIKCAPISVNKNNEREILNTAYKKNHTFYETKNPKFSVGDIVRISRHKSTFEKGYLANWTTELFIVNSIHATEPVTYTLHDLDNLPISGKFYEYELKKTMQPTIYLVEKILKRHKNNVYVKWLGMDKRSWIAKKDFI